MFFKRIKKRVAKIIISISALLVCLYFINPDIKSDIYDLVKEFVNHESDYSIKEAVTDSLREGTERYIDIYFEGIEDALKDIKEEIDFDYTAPAEIKHTDMEEVKYVRTVDGDTLVVSNNEGLAIKVRLIGIDTPESVHSDVTKNTEYGIMASDYTKNIMKEYDTLYLSYDKSKTDQFGRTLAYVWLNYDVDVNDIKDIAEYMLNGKLLAEGYAMNKEYPPNTYYSEAFEEIRENAERESQGLWKSDGFVELWKGE